jgi:MFS family permease
MVWVLAVTETVSYAALFYCFAVMVVPMRADIGVTTAQASGALTLAIAVTGVAAVPVGRLLDRYGARWLMSGGSLLGSASVVAWAQADSLLALYLAFVGIGTAGALVLYDPAFAVVNTWFHRDRTSALLTITVVAGLSSTIFVPASQVLTDRVGWRAALLVMAGLLALCAVPQALVLRRSPADLLLAPDGREATTELAPEQPAARSAPGDSALEEFRGLKSAWRSGSVRRLTLAGVLETVAVTIVAVHLVAYLRETGFTSTRAAVAAGALGVLSVAGRVVLSSLAGRVGLGRVAGVMVAGQAVGVAVLLAVPGLPGVVLFVLVFGAGYGVMTIARAALLGTYVPSSVFATVSGSQAMARNAGRVVAPVAGGTLITSLGYGAAFGAVAACSLAAAFLLLSAERGQA